MAYYIKGVSEPGLYFVLELKIEMASILFFKNDI